MSQSKTISKIVTAHQALEGGGFLVHRPFPTRMLNQFDPFLLLDEMGPSEHGPGEAKGAPDHPHKGFETVTYMLEGEMEHRDSAGNSGVIGPGDLQWMTAGSGVVHSEMPSAVFQQHGGRMHGFQLWVNLRASEKHLTPQYQEINTSRIPRIKEGRATIRVLAGEYEGQRAAAQTKTPILYLDVHLDAKGQFTTAIPPGFATFVYVFEGEGAFDTDTSPVKAHQLAILSNSGSFVLANSESSMRFLLLAGQPLNEPIARHGPFVMNTWKEIEEAFADYQAGRFAMIKPLLKRS